MASISEITQNTASTTTKTSASNTLGQEQFLTLLVAQLQNQDPLNPADATEFTAQLAQYSQLEQLFNLNEAMDGLATAQTNSQKVSALSLMGKEVLVADSAFSFDGTPTQIGYTVDGQASAITLQIKNSAGAVVATIQATETGEGQHSLTWNGMDSNGNLLTPGTYKLVVNATSASADATVTVSPLVRTQVTGVDLSGTDPLIVTQTGEFTIANILGVYDGGEETTEETNEETATTADETAATSSTTASTMTEAADEVAADIISQATDGAGIIDGGATTTATD